VLLNVRIACVGACRYAVRRRVVPCRRVPDVSPLSLRSPLERPHPDVRWSYVRHDICAACVHEALVGGTQRRGWGPLDQPTLRLHQLRVDVNLVGKTPGQSNVANLSHKAKTENSERVAAKIRTDELHVRGVGGECHAQWSKVWYEGATMQAENGGYRCHWCPVVVEAERDVGL